MALHQIGQLQIIVKDLKTSNFFCTVIALAMTLSTGLPMLTQVNNQFS
jgi:hypothetical protein